MPNLLPLSLLCLVFAVYAAGPASAQHAPQVPEPDAASQIEQEVQAEPPKSILNVEIQKDLLTVELEHVDFGSAIRAVADKAGFIIEGRSEVFGTTLTTRFADLEVERGVLRLLSLVRENNFMLHYDTKGLISKLEIFGADIANTSLGVRQPIRPPTAFRRLPISPMAPQAQRPATISPAAPARPIPPALRRRPVLSRPAAPSPPVMQPSDAANPPQPEDGDENEEPVNEIPYIAPQPRFAPAPAR